MRRSRTIDWQVVSGLIAVVLFVFAFAGTTVLKITGAAEWKFSDGSRSGVIQKLSKRGIWWKTWEGELNLGYTTSTTDEHGHHIVQPAIFHFSVSNDDVARRLQVAEVGGKRVTLLYEQWVMRKFGKGGTSYDVVDVTDASSLKAEQ